MSVFASDDFARTSNNFITTDFAQWERLNTASNAWLRISDAQRARAHFDNATYRWTDDAPHANYRVSVDMYLVRPHNFARAGPIARMPSDSVGGYVFYWTRSNAFSASFILGTLSSGFGVTVIDSVSAPSYESESGYPVELAIEVEGDQIRCYVDGVLTITATDTTFAAAGRPGIYWRNHLGTSDTGGVHADNFLAETLGGAEPIAIHSLVQSQGLAQPALTQRHAIAPASLAQSQSLDATALTQAHQVTPDSLAQAQSLNASSLTQQGQLAPDPIVQVQSLASPAILQAHIIVPADLLQAQGLDAASLVQRHQINVDSIVQVQGLTAAVLQVAGSLSVHDIDQAQGLGSAALTQRHALAPHSITQLQSLEDVDLTLRYALSIHSLVQLQGLGQSSVQLEVAQVVPHAIVQAQGVTQTGLTQYHVLQVHDLTQEQLLATVRLGGFVVGALDGELVAYTLINGELAAYALLDATLTTVH